MAFKLPGALQAHKTIHTGEKPFECDVCHQRFRMRKFLDSHYRIHTGEKPYVCQVCGQAFRQKGDHTKHLKRHADRGECSLVKTTTSTNMTTYSLQIPQIPQPQTSVNEDRPLSGGGGSSGYVVGVAGVHDNADINTHHDGTKVEDYDTAKMEEYDGAKMEAYNETKMDPYEEEMRHLNSVNNSEYMEGHLGAGSRHIVGNTGYISANSRHLDSNTDIHMADLRGGHVEGLGVSGHLGGNSQHIVGDSQHLGGTSQHIGGTSQHIGGNSQHIVLNNPHIGVSSSSGHYSVSSSGQIVVHPMGHLSMGHMEANSLGHVGTNDVGHLGQNNLTHMTAGAEANTGRMESSPHLSPLCLAVVGGGSPT